MIRTVASFVLPVPVVLTLYGFAPLEPQVRWFASGVLLAGLLVFLVVMAWCLWHVTRAEKPIVVAISSIMVTVPVLIAVFAYSYLVMSTRDPSAFSEPLSRIDAWYFTTSTFATVGFGDITALTALTRVWVSVQIAVDLLVIGGLLRLYVIVGRRRRDEKESA